MDNDNTTASDDTTTTAPVRVPNVSAGAVSGLDHEVIGSNAQAAHDANQQLEESGDGTIPPTNPDDATEPEVESEEGNADAGTPEGVVVEDDGVAGTGQAVNEETGEVTNPGEPLPTVEGQDGAQLEPAGDGAPDDTSGAPQPEEGQGDPFQATGDGSTPSSEDQAAGQ